MEGEQLMIFRISDENSQAAVGSKSHAPRDGYVIRIIREQKDDMPRQVRLWFADTRDEGTNFLSSKARHAGRTIDGLSVEDGVDLTPVEQDLWTAPVSGQLQPIAKDEPFVH
jgi:hypothetical protein